MAEEALSSALSAARRQSSFVTLAAVCTPMLSLNLQPVTEYLIVMSRTMTTGVQQVLSKNILKRLNPNPSPNTDPSHCHTCTPYSDTIRSLRAMAHTLRIYDLC
jgi:hypothetical protein